MHRMKPWSVAGVLAVLLAGCAAQQREQHLHRQVGEHVYTLPAAELLEQSEALLRAEGYSPQRLSGEGPQVDTGWRQVSGSSPETRVFHRYRVVVAEDGPSQSRVQLLRAVRNESIPLINRGNPRTAINENTSTPNPVLQPTEPLKLVEHRAGWRRDLDLEWKLLQRVEASAAQAYQASAPR
jgi:uncharacterized lipoprotein